MWEGLIGGTSKPTIILIKDPDIIIMNEGIFVLAMVMFRHAVRCTNNFSYPRIIRRI